MILREKDRGIERLRNKFIWVIRDRDRVKKRGRLRETGRGKRRA